MEYFKVSSGKADLAHSHLCIFKVKYCCSYHTVHIYFCPVAGTLSAGIGCP